MENWNNGVGERKNKSDAVLMAMSESPINHGKTPASCQSHSDKCKSFDPLVRAYYAVLLTKHH